MFGLEIQPVRRDNALGMSRNWHETFSLWAKPPSETEEQKAERVARMVRSALRADQALSSVDFDVVAVGSYRNNTNVRTASDVDLAVVLRSACWCEYPPGSGLSNQGLGFTDARYGLPEFRSHLASALRDKFGVSSVGPGRITVTVDETSARLGADVTPYLVHYRYTGRRGPAGEWERQTGVETRPSDAPTRRMIQWPEQHYQRSVDKNNATNRRYKRAVRILKRLRDELSSADNQDVARRAAMVKSCFIEHVVFNVPNDRFNRDVGSYFEDIRFIVRDLWNAARDPGRCAAFTEVSGQDPLFRGTESWSPAVLEDFMLLVWRHVGFQG